MAADALDVAQADGARGALERVHVAEGRLDELGAAVLAGEGEQVVAQRDEVLAGLDLEGREQARLQRGIKLPHAHSPARGARSGRRVR